MLVWKIICFFRRVFHQLTKWKQTCPMPKAGL